MIKVGDLFEILGDDIEIGNINIQLSGDDIPVCDLSRLPINRLDDLLYANVERIETKYNYQKNSCYVTLHLANFSFEG